MAVTVKSVTPDTLTKARVLTDCAFGKVNEVVLLTAYELEIALTTGLVDADPASVAYAGSLKEPVAEALAEASKEQA